MTSACSSASCIDGFDDSPAETKIPIVNLVERVDERVDDNLASMIVVMAAELRTLKADVSNLKRKMARYADTDYVGNVEAETEGPSGEGTAEADADVDAPDADAEGEGDDTAASDEESKDATELLYGKSVKRRGSGRHNQKGKAASALASAGRKDGGGATADPQQEEEVVVALLASEMREYLDTSSYCQTQCSLMYTAEQLRRGEPVAYAVLVRLLVAMVLSCLLIFLQNVAFAVINDEQACSSPITTRRLLVRG